MERIRKRKLRPRQGLGPGHGRWRASGWQSERTFRIRDWLRHRHGCTDWIRRGMVLYIVRNDAAPITTYKTSGSRMVNGGHLRISTIPTLHLKMEHERKEHSVNIHAMAQLLLQHLILQR